MKQVEMLKNANKNHYIVPAFNFANFEILKGLLEAVEETNSPAILQISESAINYFTEDLLSGLIGAIKKKHENISIHLDHGKSFNAIKKAIEIGFDSVMFDGSLLPFEENVRLTKSVVEFAHERNVSVEGEVGVLTIPSDDAVPSEMVFTTPQQAKEFVEKTKVDSLAVSIGTNHGINKHAKHTDLRLDILSQIENEIPDIPLVLHGASLIETKYVEIINSNGGNIVNYSGNKFPNLTKTNIAKINMDTDFRLAYTAGLRMSLCENKKEINPRNYNIDSISLVKQCAIDRIKNICQSENKKRCN